MKTKITSTPRNQNGAALYRHVRRDDDGTWSANVWFGHQCATTLRRYFGYCTKAEAEQANISELPHGGRIGQYEGNTL